MTALSNANTSRDGIKSRSIGLTSFVLPKANSSDTGVSVWYVVFASYLRCSKCTEFITDSCKYIDEHFLLNSF